MWLMRVVARDDKKAKFSIRCKSRRWKDFVSNFADKMKFIFDGFIFLMKSRDLKIQIGFL